MQEQKINRGKQHIYPAGSIQDIMILENRHNVAGSISYQIGNRPMVTIQIRPNEPGTPIINIDGLSLLIRNNLPSSIYCVWHNIKPLILSNQSHYNTARKTYLI